MHLVSFCSMFLLAEKLLPVRVF